MKHIYEKMAKWATGIVLILLSLWFIKGFNPCWVQTTKEGAEVTINFLFPMKHEAFQDSIEIMSQIPYANQFDCEIRWLTKTTVNIKLKEKNDIKGQKVQLIIHNAPTQIPFIDKNCNIGVQFKHGIQIVSPQKEILITTEKPFLVQFNTPIRSNTLSKYLKSDAAFYITPLKIKNTFKQEVTDETRFLFTPKRTLENDRKYLLTFKKGMTSEAGVMLEDDINIILKTDKKPRITNIYPKDGQKWVGLYPKITLATDYPISRATLSMEGENLEGTLIDDYDAAFLLNKILETDKSYRIKVQVASKIGELSKEEEIEFKTVPIPEDRIWLEVTLGKSHYIKVYQGMKVIKKFICSGGEEKTPTPLGTYYIQDRGEQFFSEKLKEGANYWMKINDQCMLHGFVRDASWKIDEKAASNLGKGSGHGYIRLKDEDAKWLYQNIQNNTMIILHK